MICKILVILSIFILFITACNKITSPTINPEVLSTATPPPSPESGKASMIGQVMHQEGYGLSNTIVRLAEVARGAEGRGGAYILDISRSPGTITDENGRFAILNVKAGEYVIVVGD